MTNLLPDPTNLPAKKADMRAFLDTEFLEANGHFKFISVGLVTDRGHEFYAEVPVDEAEKLLVERPNEFVRAEVLPQFGVVPVEPWADLPGRLASWFQSLGNASVEVVYDYSGDFLLIEQLQAQLGAPWKVSLVPTHVGYLLEDADGAAAADACWQAVEFMKGVKRHHALADAFALRARFERVHWCVEKVETRVVELHATVTVLVPEFELVHAETQDGITVSIGKRTKGVAWRKLKVGQLLRCVAQVGGATRVLSAEVVAPSGAKDLVD